MKTLRNPWFIISFLIWLIVITLRKMGHAVPVLNGYIDDVAAIPVMANLALWFQRVFIIKNDYYVLAPWHVIFIVAYVAVVFEGLLPLVSKIYTADPIDVLLYALGGLFFYRIMNKPISNFRTGNIN